MDRINGHHHNFIVWRLRSSQVNDVVAWKLFRLHIFVLFYALLRSQLVAISI